jgi:hypothetical protein
MKITFNNCDVKINNSIKESRNKVVKNGIIHPSSQKWYVKGDLFQCYFVNLYEGDEVLVTNPNGSNEIRAAFVASTDIVNGQSPTFANNTTESYSRADLLARHSSVIENCYLYVLCKYSGDPIDYTVKINNKILDENGYL